MEFALSTRVRDYQARLEAFMAKHIYPNERQYYQEAEQLGPWQIYPVLEELKPLARAAGLLNLFLPDTEHGAGLSDLDYAPPREVIGGTHLAPEGFNCSAPDTRNMEG